MPWPLVCVCVFRGKRKKNNEDYFHLYDQNKTDNLFDYFVWLLKHDRQVKRIKFALYDEQRPAFWWEFDRRDFLTWLLITSFMDMLIYG